MKLVSIPPGGAAIPHFHRGFETAIYIIKGRVETRYGPGLTHSTINQAGDFLYIPADLPHQPINLSKSEPALAIVSRNDPNEQESVVHIHRLRKRYTALLREEVGRTVSDPAEIDEEIHALCEALIATEGRLGP
jgi:uncharacterized RmlC-like cupin family protein